MGRHFEVISPEFLEKEDFEFLDQAPYEKKTFSKRIVMGQLLVWRFTSRAGRGVLVTSVELTFTGERELFIWWVCGTRISYHYKWILNRLAEFARFNSCTRLALVTRSKELAGLYRRAGGFSEESVKMVKEV